MIILLCSLLLSSVLARRLSMSMTNCLPLGFCLLTALASASVTALSIFSQVTQIAVYIWLALVIGASCGMLRWMSHSRAERSTLPDWTVAERLLACAIAVPALIAALNGALFSPINWDSMTYHLSRVAFWIQHQSVFPYPSNNFRQVQHTPGAEYLLLIEQLVWFSDTFANYIQLTAFICILGGAYGWLMQWGLPRFVTLCSLATFGLAPMALLQAQTTQNDLAASVPALCLVAMLVDRVIRFRAKFLTAPLSLYEAIALPIATATSHLIKPTGSIVAVPYIALLAIPALRSLTVQPSYVRQSFAAVVLGLFAALPELIVRFVNFGTLTNHTVAVGVRNPGEQLFNGVRHIVDHLPSSLTIPIVEGLAPWFGTSATIVTRTRDIWIANEDLAGNPLQGFIALILITLLVSTGKKLPTLCAGLLVGSWFLFHAIVVNQPWSSRLQTPWFISLLCASAVLYQWRPQATRVVLTLSALGSLFYAALTSYSITHQLLAYNEWSIPTSRKDRYHGYFLRRPSAEIRYSHVKEAVGRCPTIGYVSREDSYDYPFAWAAVRNQRTFVHLTSQDTLPPHCILQPR